MTDYWFKPKTYGYGATPANWKGWVATIVFILIAIGASALLLMLPAYVPSISPPWGFTIWLIGMAALTLGFVRLCKQKTDGDWRWRMGNEK